MSLGARTRSVRPAALALALAAVAACGGSTKDPNNREIPWKYGPTTAEATPVHMSGTGTKGGAPVAKGWKCRLRDGKHLTVQPYELAATHPLFGKVAMRIALFDKNDQPIETLRSPAITAQDASPSFELTDDVARRLWDVVIWYVAV